MIVTCCYCGRRALVDLSGAGGAELRCSGCSAPLPLPAHASGPVPERPAPPQRPARPPARETGRRDRRDRDDDDREPERRRPRRRHRGGWGRLLKKLADGIEDILD